MSFEWVGGIAALAVVVLIWWPIRLAIAHGAETRFEQAHLRDSDGIIIGAEPIHLRGVRPGAVLLLHGFNDSPQAVASLAGALHDAGWSVFAPVLPGHARTLQAFSASGADAWISAARAALRALHAQHGHVATCGLSMGGALALILASEHPEVEAVVGIAPYVHLSLPLRALLVLSPIAAIGSRYLSAGGGRSVHDPEAARRMISYRTATPRLLRELAKVAHVANAGLQQVRQPVMVIQSREDNRIPARYAETAFARIGSIDKTLEWVSNAGHVITVDHGHEEVERRITTWLSTRLP